MEKKTITTAAKKVVTMMFETAAFVIVALWCYGFILERKDELAAQKVADNQFLVEDGFYNDWSTDEELEAELLRVKRLYSDSDAVSSAMDKVVDAYKHARGVVASEVVRDYKNRTNENDRYGWFKAARMAEAGEVVLTKGQPLNSVVTDKESVEKMKTLHEFSELSKRTAEAEKEVAELKAALEEVTSENVELNKKVEFYEKAVDTAKQVITNDAVKEQIEKLVPVSMLTTPAE